MEELEKKEHMRQETSSGQIRVLLVEDDPGDARLVRMALSSSDYPSYRVEVFKQLSTAIEQLNERSFDVALVDLSLPDSKGLDIISKISAKDSKIPIVVLTGLNDEEVGLRALQKGAEDYLIKGPDVNNLLTKSIRYSIERKKTKDALEESENRYSTLVELSNDGIMMIQGRRIVFANRRAYKMLEYTEPELRDLDFLYLVSEHQGELFEQRYKDRMEAKDVPSVYQIQIKNKYGEYLWVEISGSCVEYNNKPTDLVFLRDITNRKWAEEALKEYSERLEEMVEERTKDLQEAQDQLVRREKLAVLGQLAAGVSHELRNPIGAIKNAAYFLNMAIQDGEPEVKEALEILEKEVNTSDAIISGMLDYARPKPANRLKVGVNDVVQEGLSRVRVPENVEVVNQLNETSSTILADPDQLGQVFRNIIHNAIQAMPEGGRLFVKSEAPSPEWVTVSFTDTGVGIDEETLGKVFEPLFTTKARGIGLGLALTKMLTEAHGGTIEGESEVGKGSTFTVKLPMKD